MKIKIVLDQKRRVIICGYRQDNFNYLNKRLKIKFLNFSIKYN